ncbi:hypothetical protein [Bacillus atrophaeus]|nr:hypothetical protein [Bacillus atrophaeus]MEC0887261.1 hypothetical protein [Bacillus atrophaeus]
MPEYEEDCHTPSEARLGVWEAFFCFFHKDEKQTKKLVEKHRFLYKLTAG